MNHAPRAASSWKLLRRNLGGFFTARARGLLATEFTLLDPEGKEFGRLRLVGSSGAELRSGNHIATLEASEERYRMVAGNNEVLTAAPKGLSIDKLEVYCDNQTYEAQVSFFRNLAVASHVGDARKVRVSGDLTGRNYETLFAAEDRCALPVAVFLLWHVATNRRGAFRAGSLARGGVA